MEDVIKKIPETVQKNERKEEEYTIYCTVYIVQITIISIIISETYKLNNMHRIIFSVHSFF